MDADTRTLIERTRQRREILNQRFAGMPEAAPRKRRTPVLEADGSERVISTTGDQDDSPKRQCLRDVELNVKQDTPAIRGVQSRIKDLKSGDSDGCEKDENMTEEAPTPKPRKSVSSPPLEKKIMMKPAEAPVTTPSSGVSSSRKGRFAALAQNIKNWEDDLTHHVVHKEEEKKPRWQPAPKSGKGPAPSGPAAPTATTCGSPAKIGTGVKKGPVPTGPVSPTVNTCGSPGKIGAGVKKGPASSGTASPAVNSCGAPAKIGVGINNEMVSSPKKTPAPPAPGSPASALARNSPLRASKVPDSTLSASTPARTKTKPVDPAELPVSQRMSHMQEKLSKKLQDEPTAYSVGARMSAWEDMTVANKVSDIKKVNPGQTPSAPVVKPASIVGVPSTPKAASAPAHLASNVPQNPPPPPKLITTKSVAPSKSFKESLEEKAAEVSRRTGLQYAKHSPVKPVPCESTSPTKTITHSPKKMTAATRDMQQLLTQRSQENSTTCSQMAAQNRAARAAELATLSNRWKNGILREEGTAAQSEVDVQKSAEDKETQPNMTLSSNGREAARDKAREEFNKKLAATGLTASSHDAPQSEIPHKSNTASIYNLIKRREEGKMSKAEDDKQVKFCDSFDDSDDESDRKIPKTAAKRIAQKSLEADGTSNEDKARGNGNMDVENADDDIKDDSTNDSKSSLDVTDDDISLRGFVSEAVRRESIRGQRRQASTASSSSLESYDKSAAPVAAYHSDEDDADDDESTDDNNKRKAVSDFLDDAFDDTIDDSDTDMDVLKEAAHGQNGRREVEDRDYHPDMDINNVVMRRKPSQPTSSQAELTDDDEDARPYSLQAYRKSATIHQQTMAPVVRSSKYVGQVVKEESFTGTHSSPQPRRDDRKAVLERIKELKELVQQEQSVIMQTSNALNKCCVGNPVFAGSTEQVECNRVLLLACQRRQCYMTEIERLKSTGQLCVDGPGPRGSLTISDIRLPLKKDFVTKIGTSHDTTTHFFILLIRNGARLICTQMLSSHDPMMRGSLDFPNLIKINGITGNFKLTMDIYGMSVSREAVGKDKKKKTPKKHRGFPLESPGGPSAVRTTSFSHVTSLMLTKKSLDKSSFHLERLSYLSPLYGQIFMRLKCSMETNVEERGFLTMFDDVSGFGAWHRRWCVLTGNRLCIWKYPDDETRKDPMSVIDLKRCISEKVGLVSRDICARPNTFEMVTVRQPLKGEHDTLITHTYNSTTSVRHQMSADSKEERIVWCNKINRTLANLRTWNADALKPSRPPPVSSSR